MNTCGTVSTIRPGTTCQKETGHEGLCGNDRVMWWDDVLHPMEPRLSGHAAGDLDALEKVKAAAKKIGHLFDHPDEVPDFDQQLAQLLCELDAACKPLLPRFLKTSYKPPVGDAK